MIPHSLLKQYPLGDRPANWGTPMNIYWVLTYSVDTSTGALIFGYQEPTTAPLVEIRSFSELAALTLGPIQPLLDLQVPDNAFLEIWLDPSKNMQWSRSFDAITTKDDYRQYYFELRLRNGSTLYTPDQFPAGAVPLVARFGALHRTHLPPVLHGFSMNLELVYPGKPPLPITIDPDIRNPSV